MPPPEYAVRMHGRPSTLGAILRQLCPRCRTGRIFQKSIFTGFPRMNQCCPSCGLKFGREAGYFLGAMYISYGLGVVAIILFAFLLWEFTHWTLLRAAFWGMVLFLPIAPGLALFSRVLWIYLDQAFDPE